MSQCAVDTLNEYHINLLGQPRRTQLPLISQPSRDVITNNCDNPQVLSLGKEGCDHDRCCYSCDHYSADPSNIDDIKSEIQTCIRSINLLETRTDNDMKPHRLAVLRERWQGWQHMLTNLENLIAELEPAERERIEVAATTVRQFRNQTRSGGINITSTEGITTP